MALAACAGAGTGDITADQVALAPLPTVGGVGVLPSTVPPEREPLVESDLLHGEFVLVRKGSKSYALVRLAGAA